MVFGLWSKPGERKLSVESVFVLCGFASAVVLLHTAAASQTMDIDLPLDSSLLKTRDRIRRVSIFYLFIFYLFFKIWTLIV